jgi:uncharacterized protein YdaU (DUF1376 family)
MARDPAFLFYPDDWLGGTMNLNLLEKGCYFELLILQFQIEEFSQEEAKEVLGKEFKKVWPKIQKKFVFSNDKFYSPRLRQEMLKRKAYTNSRRNNALQKSKNKQHMHNHMQVHMGNGNGNRNNIEKGVSKKIGFTAPTIDEVKAYFTSKGYDNKIAQKAFDYYDTADWIDANGKKVRNWKQKMIANWFRPENKINETAEIKSSRTKEIWQ